MLAARTIRAMAILFSVAALSCFLAQDAQAQCGHRGYRGYRGGGLRISVGYGGGGYLGQSVGYYGARPRVWHDSHFVYHPGRYARHGGRRYGYRPRHYDYHRGGHRHH